VAEISKSPRRIAGMFDAIAERYDLLNHLLSAGIDRRWRRLAVRSLGLAGGETVLDLCTGTADLAVALHAGTPTPARVVGVDFSAAMLRVGIAKVVRRGLAGRVNLLRGDVTRIPVATSAVDAVTMAFGIRNVEDPALACVEMRRVLRPRSRFAVLEFAIPGTPGLRDAYVWYFNTVLPRIGRLVSKHDAAYDYLPASVKSFARPAELVELLRLAGFEEITSTPLSGGIVYLYAGRAPGPGLGDLGVGSGE
jgi:demethylmenaquinone methyltransferase/2-methoxy-6-polyprenyl-1,4-benzoquinol methylase